MCSVWCNHLKHLLGKFWVSDYTFSFFPPFPASMQGSFDKSLEYKCFVFIWSHTVEEGSTIHRTSGFFLISVLDTSVEFIPGPAIMGVPSHIWVLTGVCIPDICATSIKSLHTLALSQPQVPIHLLVSEFLPPLLLRHATQSGSLALIPTGSEKHYLFCLSCQLQL